MLGNGENYATAEAVKLPDDGYYQGQQQQQQYAYAQPVQATQQVYNAQPVQNGYAGSGYGHQQQGYYQQQQQYVAQPIQQSMQQPVAPVYVASAGAPQQYDMHRYKYEADIERQRRMDAEMHARNVDMQIRYEQRRRQQEQEEACCCLALSAVCCAAFLAAN